MAPMTAAERTLTRTYGLLASRLTELLTSLQQKWVPPGEMEVQVLENGEQLLDEFIRDSRLIEGDTFEKWELAPRLEGIKTFRHAFGTLQQLRRLRDDEKVYRALMEVRDSLRSIRHAEKSEAVDPVAVEDVKRFFTVLTDLLADDLSRQRLESAAPQRTNTQSERE